MATTRTGRSGSKSTPNLSVTSAPPNPSISTNPYKTWVLLVCGAPPKTDAGVPISEDSYFANEFLIGDFAGIMQVLHDLHGIKGEFWTCLDLASYVNVTEHKDIKFGRGNEVKTVYTQWQGKHRQLYEFIAAEDLKGRVVKWIQERAVEAKEGDTIEIIFVTHGNERGDQQLGRDRISVVEMRTLLQSFKQEVEVNVITSACFGGFLPEAIEQDNQEYRYIQAASQKHQKTSAIREGLLKGRSASDRYQCSYFGVATVKSLGKIKVGGNLIARKKHTLGTHLSDLAGGILGGGTPSVGWSNPVHYTDWSYQDTLSNLLKLDYVDFPANQTASSRYLGAEGSIAVFENISDATPVDDGYAFIVEDTLSSEVERMDEVNVVNEDMALLASIQANRTWSTSRAFLTLLVRLRVQSTVFEVFMTLYIYELVSISALELQVDLDNTDSEVFKVFQALLRSFQFGETLNNCPNIFLTGSYAMPLIWLSCMIVRGARVRLPVIVEFICRKGAFGDFNLAEFREWWPEGTALQVNPEAQATTKSKHGYIGVYLPMGLNKASTDDVYDVIDKPLQRLEALFAAYFMIAEEGFVPAGKVLQV